MSTLLPHEIAEAVVQLDLAAAGWPEADRLAWRLIRGFMRRQHRSSQTQLPVVGLAAMEMIESRNHAQAAIDAMTGVFGRQQHEVKDDDDDGK